MGSLRLTAMGDELELALEAEGIEAEEAVELAGAVAFEVEFELDVELIGTR